MLFSVGSFHRCLFFTVHLSIFVMNLISVAVILVLSCFHQALQCCYASGLSQTCIVYWLNVQHSWCCELNWHGQLCASWLVHVANAQNATCAWTAGLTYCSSWQQPWLQRISVSGARWRTDSSSSLITATVRWNTSPAMGTWVILTWQVCAGCGISHHILPSERTWCGAGLLFLHVAGADWTALNRFAHAAGLHLLFDLNVLLRNGTEWDSSNARLLLDFTDKLRFDVSWQLGNGTVLLWSLCSTVK
jgi:hypothetical protein